MKRIWSFFTILGLVGLFLSATHVLTAQQNQLTGEYTRQEPRMYDAEDMNNHSISPAPDMLFNFQAPQIQFASMQEGLKYIDENQGGKPCPILPPMDEETRKILIGLAEDLVDSLVQEDFRSVYKQFDSSFKKRISREDLKNSYRKLIDHFGYYRGRSKTPGLGQCETERYVYITCRFEDTSMDAKVTFNGMNKVCGLSFEPAWYDSIGQEKSHEIKVNSFQLYIDKKWGFSSRSSDSPPNIIKPDDMTPEAGFRFDIIPEAGFRFDLDTQPQVPDLLEYYRSHEQRRTINNWN